MNELKKINTISVIVVAHRSTVYRVAAFFKEFKCGEMWLHSVCDLIYGFCGLLQILSLGMFATEISERTKPPGLTHGALSFNPIAHFPELPVSGVNSFVRTGVRDSHRQPHVIYPTIKHLLCKALMKASGGRIDKPFLTTAA